MYSPGVAAEECLREVLGGKVSLYGAFIHVEMVYIDGEMADGRQVGCRGGDNLCVSYINVATTVMHIISTCNTGKNNTE